MVEAREEAREHAARIADEARFDGIAQPDALPVDIDLHRARLPGLRVVLDVGIARSDDQERVAPLERVLRGRGAEKSGAASGVGAIVGQRRFPEERLDHRRTKPLSDRDEFVAGAERASSRKDADPAALVQDRSRARELILAWLMRALGHEIRDMAGDVALRALVGLHRQRLSVDGHGDVRDAAAGQRGAAGELDHVLHMGRAHDAVVVDADVLKQLVELDILLRQGADQVVVLQARDGEHRLAIELGVVKTVEQVDAAGTGGREAHAQFPGPFGIAAGHEGRASPRAAPARNGSCPGASAAPP